MMDWVHDQVLMMGLGTRPGIDGGLGTRPGIDDGAGLLIKLFICMHAFMCMLMYNNSTIDIKVRFNIYENLYTFP